MNDLLAPRIFNKDINIITIPFGKAESDLSVLIL